MFTGRNRVLLGTVTVLVALGLILFLAGGGSPAVDGTATVQLISPAGYQDRFVGSTESHLLIDVRTPAEFATGHIPGAINIPVDELANRLSEVPDSQPVVVYCRSGNRSAQAGRTLAQAGYTDIYDLGGLNAWTAQGLPVQ